MIFEVIMPKTRIKRYLSDSGVSTKSSYSYEAELQPHELKKHVASKHLRRSADSAYETDNPKSSHTFAKINDTVNSPMTVQEASREFLTQPKDFPEYPKVSPNVIRSDQESEVQDKRKRWLKTAEVLQKSGLLQVTIKTAELLKQNKKLQKDLEDLRIETKKFITSVLSNPENKKMLGNYNKAASILELNTGPEVQTHQQNLNFKETIS